MRRLGWIAVALAAGCLLPAPAEAADAALTADPAHGPAGQPVTFTYHYSGRRCQGATVYLLWDTSDFGSGRMDDDCTARLTVTPPANAHPGPHQVVVWFNGLVSTTYTIDAGPPTASPDPSPSPGPPSASPPLPSPSVSVRPSPSGSPTPTPTPTKPPPAPSPSESSSAAPPATSTPVEPAPTGPCDPGNGPDSLVSGQLSGALFSEPVVVHEVEPARIRPAAVDFSGNPQIRVTIDTLPDPTPVNSAVDSGQPIACLHLDLPAGDGYQWASYAFRDVLLSAYESGTPTSVLSFSYGGVAWRYARPSGVIVTGDTTAPPHPSNTPPIGWLVPGTGAVLVIIGASVWWRLRRTRHVGTRRL